MSTSNTNEDLLLSNNNQNINHSNCLNNTDSNDMTTKEDAVVPNFECE